MHLFQNTILTNWIRTTHFMVRNVIAGLLAALVSIAAFSPGSHAADTNAQLRKLEDLAAAFDESALRVNGSRVQELARWTGTIYLAIADTPGIERVAGDIEALVGRLATVARVGVERVAVNDKRRNFYVRASTRESNGSHPCLSAVDWDDLGRIVAVEVHLNLSNHARLSRCARHEVVHGFGLRDHPRQAHSILSYRYADQAQLTEADEIILATLYDPRLPATGPMAQTSRLACGLIAEKLRLAPTAAAPVCLKRGSPAREGLFAARGIPDARERIGQ
jgi:hypothetical protein